MVTVGKYCKAYPLERMCEFNGWSEKPGNARKKRAEEDSKEVEAVRGLADDSIVYLQENYVVTDGIFKDENVLFDDVTPEWIEYCQNVLKFEIPEYVRSAETPDQTEGGQEAGRVSDD